MTRVDASHGEARPEVFPGRAAPDGGVRPGPAVVTGGGRGIGLAVARALQAAGHPVTVLYRATRPPDLPAVQCDLTDRASVDDACEQVRADQGPIQVLVANAGQTADAIALRLHDADVTDLLDVNTTGAFRAVRAALPDMLRARYGRVVLISSITAATGAPGQVNYGASKAALVGMARALVHELGPRGITVNVVLPGLIDTDMAEAAGPKRRASVVDRTPLGRIGRADEVAAAVRFLASAEASYITGAALPVAGGYGMGV